MNGTLVSSIDHSPRIGLGVTIWLTGLSGSGKSTVATLLGQLFESAGHATYLLDGDKLRTGLNSDLGLDKTDRDENVRRVAEVAKLFAGAGLVAIAALISPYAEARQRARTAHEKDGLHFFEIHVATPLEVCESRDPKGLYAKARSGSIKGFTGIDDPYETPDAPDFRIEANGRTPAQCATELYEYLIQQLDEPQHDKPQHDKPQRDKPQYSKQPVR